ncbi:MAG: sigma-70 family RNA polymerase sigma factor [Planctomycetota bacterium]
MGTYKLDLVHDLARQLHLSPRAQRELQISRLRHLIDDVRPGRKYPENFVVYRLTLYHPPASRKTCKGKALKADLITLLDELSGTLDLPLPEDDEVLTLDQIRDAYDISPQTLAAWREEGLITERYIFPDGAQRSAARKSHVAAFVASLDQGPMFRIRVPNDKQTELIVSQAKALAESGNVSKPEAVRRLSARLEFPPRLIRHAIRKYQMEHAETPLFRPSGVPLDEAKRRKLLAAHRQGQAQAEMAKQLGISRRLAKRYLETLRAEELLRTDVEYRYDPLFDEPDADERILNDPALDEPAYQAKPMPDQVPAYFADLSHRPILKKQEETALFRKYNYIKYKFARLRRSLKPSEGDDPTLLARLEELAAEANRCRTRLVEANLRLIVKLARQHTGDVVHIEDLISEGNLTLMRAVDKFDFTRGTRFSTYATWSVVKRFARVVPEENYRIGTYVTGAEEVIKVQPDGITAKLERKENLAHVRAQLDKVMDQLTDREQEILRRRFGLAGSPETLKQIGKRLGITRERVRQLETRALRKAASIIEL